MRGPREHNDPPGSQSRDPQAMMRLRPVVPAHGMTYEGFQELNILIAGSPQTVIKKLTSTIEGLNPEYLILIGCDGDIQHDDVIRSIELLGKEVIPALHEIKLQPYE